MQVKQNIKEHMLKLIEEKYNTDAVFEGLLDCIEPLGTHDRKELEKIITNLKQSGGESWAVGEMLQRIIYFLGNLEGYDKEKPRYSACNADPGRTRESWDVRRFDKEEDIGYITIAVFFINDILDAEKRANDLCDELNEKELDKIMPNLPPRCGKYKLLIIDDPSRELKAKSIARDVAQKCGLRLSKDY